ncbi:MAG: ribosome-associated translation inhibitor RaiA [Xanthomonadaceae bacterium]|jgi:putative sigma-54 modulation protein|nr:ribosome-associated translation inhibitor RaiA [Xanthomonadaceae bacterium]MDE3071493.1 ribosome-associated translation inhibitor RaiA [Pseudomonadota bacterium]
MQFQLSGQHLEVTQALRDHATAKLDRLTRLDDKLLSLVIVLSIDKLRQCAEGTLAVTGATLHAEAAGADMYASIDELFDKLLIQLRKHREKVSDKHQREGREERLFG